MPRLVVNSSRSRIKALAPAPNINPFRRASNGNAASSTFEDVEAAPLAAKPEPIQGKAILHVTSSAVAIITLSHLLELIQSSATAKAEAPEAQALFVCKLGPRAPIN